MWSAEGRRSAELEVQVHELHERDGEEGELGVPPRDAGEENEGEKFGGAQRPAQAGGEARGGHQGRWAQVHVRATSVYGGGAVLQDREQRVDGGRVEELWGRRLAEGELRAEEQKGGPGVEQDLQGERNLQGDPKGSCFKLFFFYILA